MIVPETMKGKSIDEWIDEYAESHQNRVNRWCHTLGIPMIGISLMVTPIGFFASRTMMWIGAALFVFGWVLQFVGHAFEGKPPEFFRDWRFLLVGTKWWWRKVRGRD